MIGSLVWSPLRFAATIGLLIVSIVGVRYFFLTPSFSPDYWHGRRQGILQTTSGYVNNRLPMIADLMGRVLPVGTSKTRVYEVLGGPEHVHERARAFPMNPLPTTRPGDVAYLVWTTGGSFKSSGPVRWLVIGFREEKLTEWRVETVGQPNLK